MQSLLSVYQDIEKLGIPVIIGTLDAEGSIAVKIDDDIRFIVLDKRIQSEKAEKVQLTHELGHHQTDTIYHESDNLSEKSRCEYRANKWAVHRLLPYEDMKAAMEKGIIEIWELAEYFDVTEDFIQLCFRHYQDEGLYFPPVCGNE